MAPGMFSEELPEPAKAGKAGAAKKPAAHVACKRPAAAKAVGKKLAKAKKDPRAVSKRFGFIHETRASQKACTNAKPEMADKLHGSNATGVRQLRELGASGLPSFERLGHV